VVVHAAMMHAVHDRVRGWPSTREELVSYQHELAVVASTVEPWSPPVDPVVGGCFVAFARGATARLGIDGDVVAHWVRTRSRTRPVVAHAAWRTTPETATAVVLHASPGDARTPAPLQHARRAARAVRARGEYE
jgi:hypothetical protein